MFLFFFQVNVSINLRNVLEVNEISQMLTLESSIRMWWEDQRVRPVINRDSDEVREIRGREHALFPSIFVFIFSGLCVRERRPVRVPLLGSRPVCGPGAQPPGAIGAGSPGHAPGLSGRKDEVSSNSYVSLQ